MSRSLPSTARASAERAGPRPQVPAYLRIAEEIRRDMDAGLLPPGSRLPAERMLAARFDVNRQTLRSALQQLREEGLVVTDKRGSFVADAEHPPPAGRRPAHLPVFPGGAGAGGARTDARLYLAGAPAALADLLAVDPGEPVLAHRHCTFGAMGEVLQEALTHFSPVAVDEIPELRRYRARLRGHQPDLRLLYHWMDRAGLRPAMRESITLSRRSARPAVRRLVRDGRGRVLEVTDLSFTPVWDELVFEYQGPGVTAARTAGRGPGS
ncbi:winged helix-turn-helix domain-containing protein [Streptomyces sp. NRRL S-87]|uniref:GntR family transcriptional regulator n=1 Tax=Streptomyces sp. NRRL S-87 TaxID=1463920 RepID=UPI00068A29DF|nr:winged helix-turn-helix domain-containing protein [Streptomyces sp. NRRL S-87]